MICFRQHQMDTVSHWYGGPPWQQAFCFRRGNPSIPWCVASPLPAHYHIAQWLWR